MRRILYLSRGGAVGGSQRQLRYIISRLSNGCTPIVICHKEGPFVAELDAAGVSVVVLPLRPWRKLPNVLSRYRDVENLVRFAERQNVDLVHSSDLWMNEYLIRVAKKLNIPSVLHVRRPVTPAEIRKHNFGKASVIVAISQRVERNLIAAGIAPEKIALIEDAVDLNVFRPNNQPTNVLRRDFASTAKVHIGIVGWIKPSKHQLEFLQAAAQVKRDSSKSVAFFIIGDTYSHGYFAALKRFVIENGLDGHVFFTGRRDDMPEILGSLDILVSLSGGSVMFEAMACGKCVVSAGFTSKEDSVHIQDGRTGVLLESREPMLLADTLLRLIEHTEVREEIGCRATKWAGENLGIDRMIAKIGHLYDRLTKDEKTFSV